MNPAFHKEEEFLEQARQVLATGGARLWWLGQSGFLLIRNGRSVLFDPYLSDSLTRKYAGTDKPHVRLTERVIEPGRLAGLGSVELITCSHNHTDHLDSETLLPLLAGNPRARLVIPAANRAFVLERLGPEVESRLLELDHGKSRSIGELELHGIASAHPTVERDEAGRCRFLGYVLRWDRFTVYHSGDTVWHQQLQPSLAPFTIDIALLPINGDRPERRVAGNLDGPQAAQLAKAIGARIAIPCHYDMFEFNTASPEPFVEECRRLRQKYILLRNGEGINV